MSTILELNYETVEQLLAELMAEYDDQQRGFKSRKWPKVSSLSPSRSTPIILKN